MSVVSYEQEQSPAVGAVHGLEDLSKHELLDFLCEYDSYIQDANDDNRYTEGWYPVCVNEFYDTEYKALLEERTNQTQIAEIPLAIPKTGQASYTTPNGKEPIAVFLLSEQKHSGKSNGTWLNLPSDAETLRKALKRIGAEDGKYAISAAKATSDRVEALLPIVSGIDELNMLAHYMKNMEAWELNKLEGILQSGVADIKSVADTINILYEDNFDGINSIMAYNAEELGRYWDSEAPDAILEGMSLEEYGRQCVAEEKGVFTDYGYMYVKLTPQAEYTGVVPEEYRIDEAAATMRSKEPKAQSKPREDKKSLLDRLESKKQDVAKNDVEQVGKEKGTRKRSAVEQGD